jgi:hypothetical protein
MMMYSRFTNSSANSSTGGVMDGSGPHTQPSFPGAQSKEKYFNCDSWKIYIGPMLQSSPGSVGLMSIDHG